MTVIQDSSCPIKNAIWSFLNHYAYGDALFLAERLYAEVGSDEALFLLATAYYRLGKPKIVQVLFKKHGAKLPECKLLYAQACFDEAKYAKAEQVLIGCPMKFKNINIMLSEVSNEYAESGCFALSLLGRMYQQTERPELAETCFLSSLKANPFLWSSFEKLCESGKRPNPEEHFCAPPQMNESRTLHSFNSTLHQTPPFVMPTRKKSSKVLTPSHHCSNTEGADATTPHTAQVVDINQQITPPTCAATMTTPSNTDVNRGTCHNTSLCKEVMMDQSSIDFYRSTPSETWNSSVDSYTGVRGMSSERRPNRTQGQISKNLLNAQATLSPLTPSFGVMPLIETPSPTWDRPKSMVTPTDMAPPPVERKPVKRMVTRLSRKVGDSTATTGKLLFSSENSRAPDTTPSSTSPTTQDSTQGSVPPNRRSTRTYTHSNNSVKENAKKTFKPKPSQPKDLLKRNARFRTGKLIDDVAMKDLSDEISKVETPPPCEKLKATPSSLHTTHYLSAQKASIDGLMSLLRDMGHALLAVCQYDCRKSVECVEGLPPHQRATSWPLRILARAYFEMTEYKKAAEVFEELRSNHPEHVTGLALYSTTLWHLHDSIALSTLAHDLTKLDPMSPATWCAVGNCFSLRHDTETAVKFFTRAVQIAPRYAYAHTLLGHEFAYSDDNERAMACYRRAIHCDHRHYNAWYGIGSIYYKQESFSLAEIHFKKALSINTRSSVLLCHLGIVQHAQKRSSAALASLTSALSLEPRNPLCKFHKASILFATDRTNEALEELLQLKLIIPKESLVYFLLGKVYKVLGENHLAIMNFSWALDLDPKGINNHIKEAIDKQQKLEEGNMFDDGEQDEDDEDAEINMEDGTRELTHSTDGQDDVTSGQEGQTIPDSDESL